MDYIGMIEDLKSLRERMKDSKIPDGKEIEYDTLYFSVFNFQMYLQDFVDTYLHAEA